MVSCLFVVCGEKCRARRWGMGTTELSPSALIKQNRHGFSRRRFLFLKLRLANQESFKAPDYACRVLIIYPRYIRIANKTVFYVWRVESLVSPEIVVREDRVEDWVPTRGICLVAVTVSKLATTKGISRYESTDLESRGLSHELGMSSYTEATKLYKDQSYRCIKIPEGANWPQPKTSPDTRFNFMMKLLNSNGTQALEQFL
ncbi:unnamed protein product [Brassica napus]|uniref:(rape) hypothetical protein n=1 Tax=Brassica napus TaxID=3708 RepID=A0A816WAN4_BRANA|nr:unnamed protein product [Brassica napus]